MIRVSSGKSGRRKSAARICEGEAGWPGESTTIGFDPDFDLHAWLAMAPGSGARFALLVHHTDAEREWAYDRKSFIGHLDKALDEANAKGWPSPT